MWTLLWGYLQFLFADTYPLMPDTDPLEALRNWCWWTAQETPQNALDRLIVLRNAAIAAWEKERAEHRKLENAITSWKREEDSWNERQAALRAEVLKVEDSLSSYLGSLARNHFIHKKVGDVLEDFEVILWDFMKHVEKEMAKLREACQ